MKNYLVYSHKSPSNKYYIGITGVNPKKRWGCQGYGYKLQKKFYNAIKKYGWDNFEHKIIATDLTLDEAYKLEKELISKYDSKNNGYNADDGGAGAEGHTVSEESKKIMSQLKLGTHPKILVPKQPKIIIYLYTLDGQLIDRFLGYNSVCELLDIKRTTIINACNYNKLVDNKYILIKEEDLGELKQRLAIHNSRLANPKIFQYDLSGNLIASFITYKEASEATGFLIGDIGKCCSKIMLYKNNYIFLRKDLSETIEERLQCIKERNECLKSRSYIKNSYIIKQFDLYSGKLINTYSSYKEAAEKTNIAYKKIIANCSGHIKKIDNYYFIREDVK